MTLKSKFISIKEIEKGEKVGYEGTWEAKKKSTIGILPIGYGDGYPINLSNCGKVFIKGNLAPVIGNVSMDMVAIDLSKISKISYKDEAILWGKGHDIDTVAKYADNSPYSLMTGLTKRVKRIYLNQSRIIIFNPKHCMQFAIFLCYKYSRGNHSETFFHEITLQNVN